LTSEDTLPYPPRRPGPLHWAPGERSRHAPA